MAKVYIKMDNKGRITNINSDIFIADIDDGWMLIDEGEGDKYAHAQGNYLPDGLVDENGLLRWRLDDEGKPTLRDAAELEAELRAEVDKLGELNRGLSSLMTALARMVPMPQSEGVQEDG